MRGRIAIVDYGIGNLKSVSNAMGYLGFSTIIAGQARDLEEADAIILPGVGAFPAAAERLRESGLDRVILAQAPQKPILGICLGMQLLFDRGEEVRPTSGLGLIEGAVRKISTPLKLPHIGWNSLSFPRDCSLFRGLPEGAYVYFVHSYCCQPKQEAEVAAVTCYGPQIVAAVAKGTVYGCQFHPEKSGEVGLQILKNFGALST